MGNLITTRRSSQKRTSQPTDLGLCSIFDYEELQEATQFLNPSEVVGEGGYGVVYRGKLRDGRVVAIKELTVRHNKLLEQFINEVKLFSGIRHKNLVTLYGCTNPDDKKMLLVYEFVPNGTVADHLHKKRFSKKALTWLRRLQIAIETAEALSYLHSLQPPIIHRDVKTNNILLDNNFSVKVADFGMSRLLPPSGDHISTMPQGTQGYLDPSIISFTSSPQRVMYIALVLSCWSSCQVVLDYEERVDDEIWLVRMAFNKMKNGKLDQLVDLDLGYLEDPNVFRMVNSVARLAYECLMPTGDTRPPMMEVLKSLNMISNDHTSASSDMLPPQLLPPPPLIEIMTSTNLSHMDRPMFDFPTEITTKMLPPSLTTITPSMLRDAYKRNELKLAAAASHRSDPDTEPSLAKAPRLPF